MQCIDPKFGLPNEALDDPSNMSLIFSEGGDLSFEFNYTTMPLSPYLMWLEDNPEGTQEEFLASFLNPKHDRAEYSDSQEVSLLWMKIISMYVTQTIHGAQSP